VPKIILSRLQISASETKPIALSTNFQRIALKTKTMAVLFRPKAMIEDSSRITPTPLSATDVLMQSFELNLFDDGTLCGQLLGR
jgi:hypothetical protein